MICLLVGIAGIYIFTWPTTTQLYSVCENKLSLHGFNLCWGVNFAVGIPKYYFYYWEEGLFQPTSEVVIVGRQPTQAHLIMHITNY